MRSLPPLRSIKKYDGLVRNYCYLSLFFTIFLLICTSFVHAASISMSVRFYKSTSAKIAARRSLVSAVSLSSISAPTNASVHGAWINGVPIDRISWDTVRGAVSYNIYFTTNYMPILTGVRAASCIVPATVWHNSRYTVTAVSGTGQESIPSAPVNSIGAMDPKTVMKPAVPAPNGPPKIVNTDVEWNLESPRVVLSWQARGGYDYFKIYRDSKLISSGIAALAFTDTNVVRGETHTYAVSEVSIGWPNSEQETMVTKAAPVLIPFAHASSVSSQGLKILDIVPNDDSAKIYFKAVPGAVDYRAYKVGSPNSVKYSGGALSIEMNGIDPVAGDEVVVEAVDKLGPFQTMDGMYSPGMMQQNGSVFTAVNGQGDPSNIPGVIAISAAFHVSTVTFSLNGMQAFLDHFRNERPLVETPYASIDPEVTGGAKSKKLVAEAQNDKWIMRTYDAQPGKSSLFFLNSHFMDTLYDYNHTLRAKTSATPKSFPILKPGQVLHVTYEVDAHLSFRRLLGVIIASADDHLVFPTAGGPPTKSGNSFDWQIHPIYHEAEVYSNKRVFDVGRDSNLKNTAQSIRSNIVNSTYSGGLNGNMDSLDNRHKFDLYISASKYVAVEEGRIVKQADLTKIVNPKTHLVENQSLTWMNQSPLTINFYHSVYHTNADETDLLTGQFTPYPFYWINYRPYSDERHWDNMGFEVLNSFPAQYK